MTNIISSFRTKKNAPKVLVSLLILALIVYFSISYYALYKIVHPKPKPLMVSPVEISQQYEDISFKSQKGNIKISGWLFRANSSDKQSFSANKPSFSSNKQSLASEKTIILVSGSDQNRIDPGYGTVNVAKDLLKKGYNVLIFDFRGRGNSDYAIHTIGYFEKYDLAAAYDYLVDRGYNPHKIGILSISLGAGATIFALPLIPDVGGVVIDSPYSDVHTLITRELPSRSGLPKQFSWGISFWAKVLYKVSFDDMVPKNVIATYPDKKFLFIYGTKDNLFPIDDTIDLLKVSPKSELWLVPEAGHVKGYQTNPQAYINKVTTYFEEQLR